MMGVSHRAAHAIEPTTADLIMPERSRHPRAKKRARDVEDASFEAVSAPRDVFSMRPSGAEISNVFKTRIVKPEADGPVPRDFVAKTMAQGERLDVFGHAKAPLRSGRSMSPGILLAFLISAVTAVSAFWLAGGHALIEASRAQQESPQISAPVVAMEAPAVVPADPAVTPSSPVETPRTSADGYTAPLPRPARIERAGSILMIRPAGN